MNVAALFMRAVDNRGAVYLPYAFDGEWTEEEKAPIKDAIAPNVSERVEATFNNWCLFKAGGYFARRATWDIGNFYGTTPEELAEKIRAYYARYQRD